MFKAARTVREASKESDHEFASVLRTSIRDVADLLTELAKDGDAAGVSVTAEALDKLLARYDYLHRYR